MKVSLASFRFYLQQINTKIYFLVLPVGQDLDDRLPTVLIANDCLKSAACARRTMGSAVCKALRELFPHGWTRILAEILENRETPRICRIFAKAQWFLFFEWNDARTNSTNSVSARLRNEHTHVWCRTPGIYQYLIFI